MTSLFIPKPLMTLAVKPRKKDLQDASWSPFPSDWTKVRAGHNQMISSICWWNLLPSTTRCTVAGHKAILLRKWSLKKMDMWSEIWLVSPHLLTRASNLEHAYVNKAPSFVRRWSTLPIRMKRINRNDADSVNSVATKLVCRWFFVWHWHFFSQLPVPLWVKKWDGKTCIGVSEFFDSVFNCRSNSPAFLGVLPRGEQVVFLKIRLR